MFVCFNKIVRYPSTSIIVILSIIVYFTSSLVQAAPTIETKAFQSSFELQLTPKEGDTEQSNATNGTLRRKSRKYGLALVGLLATTGATVAALHAAHTAPSESASLGNSYDPGATRFYHFPGSATAAAKTLQNTPDSDPAIRTAIEYIASVPKGIWVETQTGKSDPSYFVNEQTSNAENTGTTPIFVLYNIPHRDCGQYSAGGASSSSEYLQWIDQVNQGLKNRRAYVLLEPDALGLIDSCTKSDPAFNPEERKNDIREAIKILTSNPQTLVYLDMSSWVSPESAASLIKTVDPSNTLRGIALGTSNFQWDSDMTQYCKNVNSALGDRQVHCTFDTARNGNGPAGEDDWCNPAGRGLGRPTQGSDPSEPLIDGYFWIKPPGESDGACKGYPAAGAFSVDLAYDLYKNTPNAAALTPQPPVSPQTPSSTTQPPTMTGLRDESQSGSGSYHPSLESNASEDKLFPSLSAHGSGSGSTPGLESNDTESGHSPSVNSSRMNSSSAGSQSPLPRTRDSETGSFVGFISETSESGSLADTVGFPSTNEI